MKACTGANVYALRAIVSIEQPSALSLTSQPVIMHHPSSCLLTVGRKSDASLYVWFMEPTPSAPLFVDALSMAVHPDEGSYLSSCFLTLIPFTLAPHLTSPAMGQSEPQKVPRGNTVRKSYMAIPPRKSLVATEPQKVPSGNTPRKSYMAIPLSLWQSLWQSLKRRTTQN